MAAARRPAGPAGAPAALAVAGALLGLALAGCGPAAPRAVGSGTTRPTPAAASHGPRRGSPAATPPGRPAAMTPPAHTVIVMMENHSYGEVIGNPSAPFINGLAARGALFTSSHAVAHPSEPNYLALFSGSTHGITDDSCPLTFTGANLATALAAKGHTFAGYAEGLPGAGPAACVAGGYARKHVPWADFTTVPRSASMPMTAFPAGNYADLATVSFVIPDLCHDMHDCPVFAGDAWLRAHLGGYAAWAMTHDSLLIVDWDENDGSPGNQIPTIFAGQMVRPGRYGRPVTHYGVLRTIEWLYGLPPLGQAARAHPVTNVWR